MGVIDMLGKNLEEMMQEHGGRFDAVTCASIGEQVVMRIEYLHSKGVIHRDIKPENFMHGVSGKSGHIYLIDFGLATPFWSWKRCGHVAQRQKLSLTGTVRYASLNAQRGFSQSRRDDLEAIGHMLFYFLRGSLPWSGLHATRPKEKTKKILEKKQQTSIRELCGSHPQQFAVYLERTRQLGYSERPDYGALKQLFREVRLAKDANVDFSRGSFPWLRNIPCESLVSLEPLQYLLQPEEVAGKPGVGETFCFSACSGLAALARLMGMDGAEKSSSRYAALR